MRRLAGVRAVVALSSKERQDAVSALAVADPAAVIASRPIGRETEQKLLAAFEAAAKAGLLARVDEPNRYLLWRFDGPGVVFKCYRSKKGLTVTCDPGELVGVLEEGATEALAGFLRSLAGPASPAGEETRHRVRVERASRAAGRAGGTGGRPLTREDLSPDQREVYERLVRWCDEKRSRLMTLGGYAGTGKSTLVSVLAREALGERNVAFCAYTGKAGNVLRQKLLEAGVPLEGTYCGTIHGLIYRAITDPDTGRLLRFERVKRLEQSLVVVDEASMLGRDIWEDLTSYDVKVLAVGDHGQLPPVGDTHISLMTEPMLRLERIHRQAEGNPIIQLATHVRTGGAPAAFCHIRDDARMRIGTATKAAVVQRLCARPEPPLEKAVLCYYNRTRVALNAAIRAELRLEGPLVPGDIVICLRNTNLGEVRIFNGMRGIVEEVCEHGDLHLRTTILFPDDEIRIKDARLLKAQIGRPYTFESFDEVAQDTGKSVRAWAEVGLLFDHGYALTVHKSQGSQFRAVTVLHEKPPPLVTADHRTRWVYTAVTRAAETLELVLPPTSLAP